MADEITPAADPAYNPADPATRQTPIDNPPDGKPLNVTYYPAPGDPDTVTAYGKTFKAGEAMEIDPKYRVKAAGNPHFSIEGQRSAGDEERERGETVVEEGEDGLTFEDNVVANRIEEYGTADPVEAERMRHLGETTFDRPAAKRRARPPKSELRETQQREEAKARAEDHDADMEEVREEQSAEQAEEERRRDEIERAQMEQRSNRGVTK